MGFIRWIKSLFGNGKPGAQEPPAGMVRFYDVETMTLAMIPERELRPGCIQARVQGIAGVVWVDPNQLTQGPIRHGEFSQEVRDVIRQIQEAFKEQRPLTFEEWEEGFRRDGNPEREIALFYFAGEVYKEFTQGETQATRRQEVYRVIIACITTSREDCWKVIRHEALSREEVQKVVDRIFNGSGEGKQAEKGE